MLKFLNPHDAVILSEMIAHGENVFGSAAFWTKRGMLGPLIRNAMLMPHVEVTISTRLSDRRSVSADGEVMLPKEIDFVWNRVNHYEAFSTAEKPLYASTFNDWLKFDEIDATAEKHRMFNGGWINHGTDLEPNWGSHT